METHQLPYIAKMSLHSHKMGFQAIQRRYISQNCCGNSFSHDVQQQVTTLYSAQVASSFIATAVCLSVGTGSLRHEVHKRSYRNLSELFYISSLVSKSIYTSCLHVVPDVLTESNSRAFWRLVLALRICNKVLLVVLGGSKIAGVHLLPA